MTHREQVAAWTAFVLFAVFGLLATSLALANIIQPFQDPDSLRLAARITLVATILGALFITGIFAGLVAGGISLRLRREVLPSLFWPVLVMVACILVILTNGAVGAVDALVHNLKLGWHLNDEQAIRLENAVLFDVFVVALGWALFVGLRAEKGDSR